MAVESEQLRQKQLNTTEFICPGIRGSLPCLCDSSLCTRVSFIGMISPEPAQGRKALLTAEWTVIIVPRIGFWWLFFFPLVSLISLRELVLFCACVFRAHLLPGLCTLSAATFVLLCSIQDCYSLELPCSKIPLTSEVVSRQAFSLQFSRTLQWL